MINGKTLLCIVDHHSKFPIVKKVNRLLADDLVQMTKLVFAEYCLLKKTASDVGTYFPARTFQDLQLHHHATTNGQVEVCIKFVMHTIRNALTLIDIFSFMADILIANSSRSPRSCKR